MAFEYALVGIGSAFGGVTRYMASNLILVYFSDKFPYSTLFVNSFGSLLVGILSYIFTTTKSYLGTTIVNELLIIGFCGGFTTFSSFGLQTVELIKADELCKAALNITASMLFSLIFVWLGYIAIAHIKSYL